MLKLSAYHLPLSIICINFFYLSTRTTNKKLCMRNTYVYYSLLQNKWMRRMRDICKSPYMGIWLFWRPGLLITSPDIAKNILVKDFGNFRDRFLSSGETDPLGGLNLFTVNVSIGKSIIKILEGILLKKILRYFKWKFNIKNPFQLFALFSKYCLIPIISIFSFLSFTTFSA